MYTEGDTTCHLMTMDPVTRTASGARQIRSPSQLTEDLALLQKCFLLLFLSGETTPIRRLCTVQKPGSNTEIQVTVAE